MACKALGPGNRPRCRFGCREGGRAVVVATAAARREPTRASAADGGAERWGQLRGYCCSLPDCDWSV